MGKLIVMPQRKQPVESELTCLEEEVGRAIRTRGLTSAALALAEKYGAEAVATELGERLYESLEFLLDVKVGLIFKDKATEDEAWEAEYALVGRLRKAGVAVEALGPEAAMA